MDLIKFKHRVIVKKIFPRFADVIFQFISEIDTMVTLFALDKAFKADTLMLSPLVVVNILAATIGTLDVQLHANL